MGINITIGQLIPENLDNPDAESVVPAEDSEAPMHPQGNHFLMSASAFSRFLRSVNLNSFFYKENGQPKHEYPGHIDLTEEILDLFLVRQRDYVENGVQGELFEDYNKLLIWMIFWINWALNNCEKPVIYLN